DFGVGLGCELMSGRHELLAQLAIVLDDAVEDDRDRVRVAAGQRVRVLLGDAAVRRPARVAEAVTSVRSVRAGCFDEVLQVPDRAHVVGAVVLAQGDAGGVVPAVLEAPETAEQKRLRPPRPDISDDPAHADRPSFRSRARKILLETRRSPAIRPIRAVAVDQPSSWVTSAAILAQRASASSGVAASARMRTSGSVPDGRTSTRPLPSSSALTASICSVSAAGSGPRPARGRFCFACG